MARRLEEKTGRRFHLIPRKADLTPARLSDIAPRYVFFPHWSYLIPEAIRSAHECIVFHMTDLPHGRGGIPLQNLIQRGHPETMLCALRCVAELGAGPIYLKRPLCLEGTASAIFLRAASTIETMIETMTNEELKPEPRVGEPEILRRRTAVESGHAQASIQDLNAFFDFIRMLDTEDYPQVLINWHGPPCLPSADVHAPCCTRSWATLVIAAHRDDEALGAGGALARWAAEGADIHVAFLADGVGSRECGAPDVSEPNGRRIAAGRACAALGLLHEPDFDDRPDNRLDTVSPCCVTSPGLCGTTSGTKRQPYGRWRRRP